MADPKASILVWIVSDVVRCRMQMNKVPHHKRHKLYVIALVLSRD